MLKNINKYKKTILLALIVTSVSLFAGNKTKDIGTAIIKKIEKESSREVAKVDAIRSEKNKNLISKLESTLDTIKRVENRQVKKDEIEIIKMSMKLIENRENRKDMR